MDLAKHTSAALLYRMESPGHTPISPNVRGSMASPAVLDHPVICHFVRQVAREARKVFPARHRLHADDRLRQAVSANLASSFDLSRQGRASLKEFTRLGFSVMVDCAGRSLPDLGWEKIGFEPARVSAAPFEIKCPAFAKPVFAADGQTFAAALARTGAECDARRLFATLASEEASLRNMAG